MMVDINHIMLEEYCIMNIIGSLSCSSRTVGAIIQITPLRNVPALRLVLLP